MRNPFARLAKHNPARPSLRERAALLKASASRVIRRAHAEGADADPILGMIEEGRRLLRVSDEVHVTVPQDPATLDPPQEWDDARDALFSHLDNAILRTVPRTAAGCRELARFGVEFFENQGVPISDDEQAIASLIAQSPLL